MGIVLPTEKSKPERVEPRRMIIFSKVKMGKTTALSLLDNNLIIDTEEGTDYLEALKIKVTSVKDILEVCKAVKAAGKPYKYITIDTATALEDIVKPYALQLWKKSPVYTDKYAVTNVTQIPNGSGYVFLREALESVIDWVGKVCENLILVCHSKDSVIGNSDVTVKDIDLAGKSGRILASEFDAIGYLYRDEDNNTILSFKRSDKFAECAARPSHLTDKNIILIENVDGKLIPHWDRIYPSEPYSGEDVVKKVSISINDDEEEENTPNEEDSKEPDIVEDNINEVQDSDDPDDIKLDI